MPVILSALSVVLLSPLLAGGWLGVYLDSEHAAARIVEVIPGTPAARAGLVPGDLVVSVDGRPIKTSKELVGAIQAQKVGRRLRLVVLRGQKRVQMLVRLDGRPGERQLPASPPQPGRAAPRRPGQGASPEVRQVPRRESDETPSIVPQGSTTGESADSVAARVVRHGYLGLGLVLERGRLRVTRVLEQGPAARAGVRVGDVLLGWNGRDVESLVGLDALLGRARPGDPLLLQLRRDDQEHLLELELGEPPVADREAPPGSPGGGQPGRQGRSGGDEQSGGASTGLPRPRVPGPDPRVNRLRAV